MLISAESSGVSVKLNTEPGGTITINESSSDLATGDIIIVCDPDHAAIVQATTYAAGAITHTKTGLNCSADLSYPTVCASTSSYVFPPNSQIAKLNAADWYIGTNPDNGQSLYRIGLVNSAGTLTPTAVEMVRGVTDMDIGYHESGKTGFAAAKDVSSWGAVNAVQVTWTMESADQKAGTDAKPLTRKFTATTTVRNRVN
jgi:type IV pilus assembly protein PilW